MNFIRVRTDVQVFTAKVIKPEENFKWLLKRNNIYFPIKGKNNKERKVIFLFI